MSETPLPKSEPLVSVVVPSYNHEKYVIDCLESVRALDYPCLELIVSDDRSPDATFDLADRWIREHGSRFVRAVAIRHPANLGIVRNLQFLFDQAQGEFIACLASDDLLVPSSIRSRLAIFRKRQGLDAVFGNAAQILADGSVLKPRFIVPHVAAQLSDSRLIVSSLILNWQVPGPAIMLRREAILPGGSLGRLPDGLQGEDGYIYIRLAARGKLAFTNEVVAQWRMVPGSLSNPVKRNNFIGHYTMESDLRNRPLVHGLDRLAIDVRIADNKAKLESRFRLWSLCKRVFFRILFVLLRFLLRVRALRENEA